MSLLPDRLSSRRTTVPCPRNLCTNTPAVTANMLSFQLALAALAWLLQLNVVVGGGPYLELHSADSMALVRQGTAPCCPLLPLRPRTTPFPEEKSTFGVIYVVLLWADMNAATPLGRGGALLFRVISPVMIRRSWLPENAGSTASADMRIDMVRSLALISRMMRLDDATRWCELLSLRTRIVTSLGTEVLVLASVQ